MIKSKNDLEYYLECDRVALRARTKTPRFFSDEMWRYEILPKKTEYLCCKLKCKSAFAKRNISQNTGDNVFVGSDAKIIGNIKISSNVAIAANTVVEKDVISENGCTVVGVSAYVISNDSSSLNLVCATEIVERDDIVS